MSGTSPVPSMSPSSTCQPDGISTETTVGTPRSAALVPLGTIRRCKNVSNGGRGSPAAAEKHIFRLRPSHCTLTLHYNTSQYTAIHYNTLQYIIIHYKRTAYRLDCQPSGSAQEPANRFHIVPLKENPNMASTTMSNLSARRSGSSASDTNGMERLSSCNSITWGNVFRYPTKTGRQR